MTFTFDIENKSKVTAYILTKGTMWMMYETDQAKGSEDTLRTSDFRWIVGHPQSRTLMNALNLLVWLKCTCSQDRQMSSL